MPVPVGRVQALQIPDVVVDQPEVTVAVEGLAHHPAGQLERKLPDLGLQLLEHPVPLGPDLVLGLGHDGPGLFLRLRIEVASGGVSAAVTLQDGFTLSDSPPLPASNPRSPLLALVGKPVDQLFQIIFDPALNAQVDLGDVSDVLLALDYTAQM